MTDITMPQLGETVTEGTITRWAKQVGDRIEEDEVLFEVSTDKVDSEVPSPTSGYVAEILVPEGETVDVGAKLAVITPEPAGGGAGPAAAPAAGAAPAGPVPQGAPPAPPDGGAGSSPTGHPPAGAPQAAAPPPVAEEAVAESPVAEAPEPAPAQPAAGDGATGGAAKVLSPVVRKLINEHGIDPDAIQGTGTGGRITRADVLAYIDTQSQAPQKVAPASPAPEKVAAAPAADEGRGVAPMGGAPPAAAAAGRGGQPSVTGPAGPGAREPERVPFTNIRRRTAEHMVRSQDTSAHTLVAFEVDYAGVERVRQAEKDRFRAEEGVGLTYLPFIARAVIDAIEEFPHVNASVGDDELVVYRQVNLGIAVDLSFEGLIVPVVHDADTKRLRALAREMADLANRARSKRLGADDISGGTFTITNPGPFGTLLTAPIINQPQVAILSTDGVKKRPVAIELPDGTDAIAVHPVGNLALSFDHRAYDGAYASAFLAKVKEIIETRDWSQEL